MNPNSFTSASALPIKLLQNTVLVGSLHRGVVPPVHVQLNPTNRCNLKCSFCSCSDRDRGLQLELNGIVDTMEKFKKLGCMAVTITGGGEPLLHPEINVLLSILNREMGIKVGLVTNGTQFKNLSSIHDITWCRISSSDDREPHWEDITKTIQLAFWVDWAFSYVLTRNPDWDRLSRLVAFANNHDFTHVRIVSDILDDGMTRLMAEARKRLSNPNNHFTRGSDNKVIYQDRTDYVPGRNRCGISLLKPVIGADGKIYPCCGVQYAQDPPGRDLVESMCMGGIQDIDRIWRDQSAFDGSVCSRCYYDDYNSTLELLSTPLCHAEFI